MIEDSCTRMIDEIRQLEKKKGPHFEHWLDRWSKAIEEKGMKIAERYDQHRWLFGMQCYLAKEQARRKEEN